MKRALLATLTSIFLLLPSLTWAADLLPAPAVSPPLEVPLDAGMVAEGLKEALTVAADRAVKSLAKPDGYSGNPAIRIGVPEELEHLPAYFRDRGFQSQVNEFILSLNRTAEKAAPKAAALFSTAIRELPLGDAVKILNNGDTAATDYFRKNCSEKLQNVFRPAIIAGMNEAGVSGAYREMMLKYDYESVAAFPVNEWPFDMEGYLTAKALDGLFRLMGEEERRIRKDPAARTTELLKKVFGTQK